MPRSSTRYLLLSTIAIISSRSILSWTTNNVASRRSTHLFDQDSTKYDLGLGKNKPFAGDDAGPSIEDAAKHWVVPAPADKPKINRLENNLPPKAHVSIANTVIPTTKKIIPRDEKTKHLTAAVWHASHFDDSSKTHETHHAYEVKSKEAPAPPGVSYPSIDLSIPAAIYSDEADVVWDTLRYEAFREAEREPLLVSFLHSTILNHKSLESSLAFHLANRLSSPAMMSTQVQSLIQEALENCPDFRRSLRADIMAVRDRDPACTCLPDVFLYFKGFHALQTHRVAHYMYKGGRQVLAHYLQSQVSQNFQIDIHPNATLGSGIMLDHGTGIVIGETAAVGHNCSILHHVTLGGSGKKGVDRHPKVGNGVLLGAGCSVLGNVKIGDGCQVGAGTLVISNLDPHSVAVGVPAKIIGSFVDVTEQPSLSMNQMTGTRDFDRTIVTFESGGI
jgi:serine O-acetyltransferase